MSAFKVSIVAGEDKASSSISVTGKVQYLTSEIDKGTFQLQYPDKVLKEGIGKYFGRVPDDHVYFESPSSKKDLFKKHGWEETQTIIEAVGAEILDVTTVEFDDTVSYDSINIMTFTISSFDNKSDIDGDFHVSAYRSATNSLSTSWGEKRLVTGEDTIIKYEVKFPTTGKGDGNDISCEERWGEGCTDAKNIQLSSDQSEVQYLVKPNTSVYATLNAKRIVVKARVRYKVHITGTMGVYYSPKFKGQHWWGLPIKDVQSSCEELPESVEITEDIEVEFYAKHKVTILDKNTNELLLTRVF